LSYVLTDAAEADLRNIIGYTRRQWGVAQVRRYVAKLKAGMANVAAGKGVFKEMDALYPKLRMMHCERHIIFCLPRENAPALVIALFHERMDLLVRIAERLR